MQPRESTYRLEDVTNVKLILGEMWSQVGSLSFLFPDQIKSKDGHVQFLQLGSDSNASLQLKERAEKVLYSLSVAHFPAVFARVAARLKLLGSDPSLHSLPASQGAGQSECLVPKRVSVPNPKGLSVLASQYWQVEAV